MASYPLGFDYSAGRPSGASLKAAGATFVIRYTDSPDRWRTKHITPAEYADVIGHGVAVYLVIEHGTTDWGGGTAAGAALARAGLAGARAIGYPADMPIFVTADGHMIEHDLPTWVNFVRGAASVLGRHATGGYAFSEGIDALVTADGGSPCDWYWQPGSRSALRAATHVYQANDRANLVIDGVACDVDEMHRPLPRAGNPTTPQATKPRGAEMFILKASGKPTCAVVLGAVPGIADGAIAGALESALPVVNVAPDVYDKVKAWIPAHADVLDGLVRERIAGNGSATIIEVLDAWPTVRSNIGTLGTNVDTLTNRVGDLDDAVTSISNTLNAVRDAVATQQTPVLDYAALASALLDAIAARRAGGTQ